jgi:hypothetical protein
VLRSMAPRLWRKSAYIYAMVYRHPHADAIYRIIVQEDRTFAVEVRIPGSFPALVRGFATEQAAEIWIAEHKLNAGRGAPSKKRFVKSPPA